MRGRVMQIGAAFAGALAVVAVVAAVLQWWWLVTAAVGVLAGAAFLAALDADRQARRAVRVATRSDSPAVTAPTPSPPAPVPVDDASPPAMDAIAIDELVGTIRVLQAQYVARMDDAQRRLTALESAASVPVPGVARDESRDAT